MLHAATTVEPTNGIEDDHMPELIRRHPSDLQKIISGLAVEDFGIS